MILCLLLVFLSFAEKICWKSAKIGLRVGIYFCLTSDFYFAYWISLSIIVYTIWVEMLLNVRQSFLAQKATFHEFVIF